MSYIIDFVGLVNFFNMSPRGGLVLLPDGRRPKNPNTPPHYANFFVEKGKVRRSPNWSWKQDDPLKGIDVVRFEVEEPSKVTLSDGDALRGCLSLGKAIRRFLPLRGHDLDISKHDPLIAKLKEIDKDFHIVPEKAETIAQMPIHRGMLEAVRLGLATVGSRLTVAKHSGELTVTAVSGGTEKSFTVADGTEIVLANMSELGTAAPLNAEDSHFKIYAQLDENRKDDKLEEPLPKPGIPPIPRTHPFIKYILGPGEFPPPGCSNTGCCSSLSSRRKE